MIGGKAICLGSVFPLRHLPSISSRPSCLTFDPMKGKKTRKDGKTEQVFGLTHLISCYFICPIIELCGITKMCSASLPVFFRGQEPC